MSWLRCVSRGGTPFPAFLRRLGAILLMAAGTAGAAIAQTGEVLLFVDSTTVIGRLEGDRLLAAPGRTAFTLRGNTVYRGESGDREDALLRIGVTDFFGRKSQPVYFGDGKDMAYTVKRGVLYLGERSHLGELERLLRVEPTAQGHFAVYSGIDDSWLGTIATNRSLRAGEMVAVLHRYVMHHDLDRQVNALIEAEAAEAARSPSRGRGIIRPAWGSNPYFEWIWDGEVLQPAWGVRSEDEWSFDGKFIRPRFGSVSRQEWVWDGKLLKKYWSTDVRDQWVWDRGRLRRFWEGNPGEEWRYEDGLVMPYWSRDPRRSWEVEGDVPLPLIALVVLGYADR